MSGLFVRTFKRESACPACPRRRFRKGDRTFSLCKGCLDRARIAWGGWAVRRRSEGRCCYCPRKSYNGWLRCRFHTLENRERSRAWFADHPGRSTAYWKTRSSRWVERGLCPYCRDHGPSLENALTCQPCKDRRNELKRGPLTVKVNGVAVFGRGLR